MENTGYEIHKITRFIFKILLFFILIIVFSNKVTATTDNEFIYLSDIDYISNQSNTAWGTINKDQASNGTKLTVKVEDNNYSFDKGIWAHATSTLVYDIREINTEYDYFTTYMGLNSTAASSSNGVKFTIYTSEDGVNWTAVTENPAPVTGPGANARYVEIPINSNVNYLKLYADSNGSNGNDHSVYADAKFVKKSYLDEQKQLVPQLSTIDEKIKEMVDNDQTETDEYELTLLQRTLIKNAGNFALTRFITESEENRTTYNWLYNNLEVLRLYLVGGKPEGGSYLNSLTVLTKLYSSHKEDLDNTSVTQYGTTLGDLYCRMMLSISLTHSANVYLWCDYSVNSDSVERYEIYKKLHQENKIECKVFESLTVEEMRWVMNTIISNEEIEWLNDFARKRGNDNPYGYIRYTSGYKYGLEKYYSADEYDKWDEKYSLSQYNITYQSGHTRLWIVFEEGAVCGGISKTGSCLWGAYRGLPNTCISQPGHCAYLRYYQNSDGDGYWQIWNNVTNWSTSGRTEHLNNRMPNDWQPDGGWAASYITLAQSAQNEYDKYEKAEIINMLADIYETDSQKLQSIYRKALQEEIINYDSWVGLINAYKMDEGKTEEDWYNLAEEMATALTYYPLPMYNLFNMISPYLTSPAYISALDLLENRILTQASKTTTAQFINADATKQVANYLLGNMDNSIASFSFDGERAGEIVLASRFDNMGVAWDYSLDGGETWTQETEHSKKLTDEELAAITSANGILVHLIGVSYEEKNIYKIDILESTGLPSTLYANDLENRFVGISDSDKSSLEWQIEGTNTWTNFSDEEPIIIGTQKIFIRKKASSNHVTSAPIEIQFTEDNQPDTRKYIPISELSIEAVSAEDGAQNGLAVNAIDGNYNTRWLNSSAGTDQIKNITIKFNNERYVCAMDYVPHAENGKILAGTIEGSLDGENFTLIKNITNWANNQDIKTIDFDEPVKVRYIRITGTSTSYTSTKRHIGARMFNFYEDTTIASEEPVNPNPSFYTALSTSNQKINAGDEFEVIASISNIKDIDKGLIALGGQLEYDKEVLEIIEISGQNSWGINKNYFNETNFKFITDNDTYITEDSTVFTVKFKAKENIKNLIKTNIKLKNIVASNSVIDINSNNAEIEIEISEARPDSITSEMYLIDNEFISKIIIGTTVGEFKTNVEAYPSIIVKDKEGNELTDNDIIATGMTVEVGTTLKYTLVVTGDIDGNGELTITDLAQLKLHYIEKEFLTGASLKAADMNYDNEITITDLAQLKITYIK